jgi:hypothetical protein
MESRGYEVRCMRRAFETRKQKERRRFATDFTSRRGREEQPIEGI